MTNDLNELRGLVGKLLCMLVWVHVLILVGLGLVVGANPAAVAVAAMVLAAVPSAMLAARRPASAIAMALAVALVGQTALLVLIFAGHPWQVEMHFYFFAVLAMLAGFCDGRILFLGAGLIALHHFIFNLFIPGALYPGGENVLRMLVHAAVVIVETGMLMVIARIIQFSFETASEAKGKAEGTAQRLENLGGRLETQLHATTLRADNLERCLSVFKAEIADSLDSLITEAKGLNTTSDVFVQAIENNATQTRAVVGAVESANMRVGNFAALSEDFFKTMLEIDQHAVAWARLGQDAATKAEATKTTIDDLTGMSDAIESAAKLIGGIANQTNLLALNATIEAARAGDHGRGFSVVAGEVKALASETAKTAQSIALTVAAIQQSARRSVGAMSSIVSAIHSLNDANGVVAEAFRSQVQAATSVATNGTAAAADVHQVAIAIEAIDAVGRDSRRGAETLRLAAGEILGQTEIIRRRVAVFAAEVDHQRAIA